MKTLVERVKAAGLPRHVAVIMDGNGRWATSRGLPRTAGHQVGAQTAEDLIRFVAGKLGLEYLTLFAFSSENWSRPEQEVAYLMDLLQQFITAKLKEFTEAGVRLRTIGDIDGLPPSVCDTVRQAVEATAMGDGLQLTIALNYGGRQEIAAALLRIAAEVDAGSLRLEDVDGMAVSGYLDTAQLPDPDLILRTSGEMRLSNFMLWQAAYAELIFTDTLWPDFTPAELVRAIAEFQRRERRYGSVEGARDAESSQAAR